MVDDPRSPEPGTMEDMHAASPRVRLPAGDRRAQLVDAAASLIAAHGFKAFTISALSRSCGISRQGILYHFGSAEEILIAVLHRRDDENRTSLLGTIPPPESRSELGLFMRALVARNMQIPEVIRLYSVLSAEALDPDHPAYDYFRERRHESTALIRNLMLWESDSEAATLALEIIMVMDGMQLAWLRDPSIDLLATWDAYGAARFGYEVPEEH